MTVKCIDVTGTTGLTLGKKYDVEKAAKGFLYIVDDTCLTQAYGKSHFEAVNPVSATKSAKSKTTSKSKSKAAKPENKPTALAKTEKSEIINKAEYSKRLETSTANIRKEIGVMAKGFVKIGYELYKVREGKLYLGQDYKNIYEYGEKVFGFQKSSIANYISVCERFSEMKNGKPTSQLSSAYSSFG